MSAVAARTYEGLECGGQEGRGGAATVGAYPLMNHQERPAVVQSKSDPQLPFPARTKSFLSCPGWNDESKRTGEKSRRHHSRTTIFPPVLPSAALARVIAWRCGAAALQVISRLRQQGFLKKTFRRGQARSHTALLGDYVPFNSGRTRVVSTCSPKREDSEIHTKQTRESGGKGE